MQMPISRWMDKKMCSVSTMEYCSATRKENMAFSTVWMKWAHYAKQVKWDSPKVAQPLVHLLSGGRWFEGERKRFRDKKPIYSHVYPIPAVHDQHAGLEGFWRQWYNRQGIPTLLFTPRFNKVLEKPLYTSRNQTKLTTPKLPELGDLSATSTYKQD